MGGSVEALSRPPLTSILLVFWRLEQLDKLHVDVELHCDNQGDLQQHQLQLPNTCDTRERDREAP